MVKIYIDSGHGGKDSGAVGNGLKEKDLTLTLSLKLDKYLRENYSDVETKLSRTTDTYPELSQRAREANNWKADLFISQHINAGGGTGIEVLIQQGVSLASATGKVAKEFNDYVVLELNKKGYKITNRGVKNQRNIAVLRESKMTAILPETLFIDTLQDANLLKSDKFLNDVVQAQAEAIAKIYHLNKKQASTASSTNRKSTKVYYDGKSIIGFIQDSTTYVQLRNLAELIGVQINYNEQTKEITFNNKVVKPLIVERRSYLPLRKVAEDIGFKVNYDKQSGNTSLVK